MKKERRIWMLLAVFLLLSVILPQPVSANSAAPPNLTIIVTGAPEDLVLSMENKGNDYDIKYLEKHNRVWERCYRIYLAEWGEDVAGYTLIASGGGKEIRCEIPKGAGYGYEDLLMLDFAAGTLTLGQPAWRKPLLVTLRVMLTLLLEGLVFFLIGYRKPVSWVIFAVINLLTQAWLNASIAQAAFSGGYWFLLFLLMEAGILIVESIAFPLTVKEKGKGMAVFHAIAANLLSLALGGWMLGSLPV